MATVLSSDAPDDSLEGARAQKPKGPKTKEALPKGKVSKAWSSPKTQGWNRGNTKPIIKGETLTFKQERFAKLVAIGESQSEAYRKAYNAEGMADGSVHNEASKLALRPHVASRINSLKAVVINEDWQDMAKMRAKALKRLAAECDGIEPDSKAATRLGAAIAIGKLTDVDLFTDHKVVEHVDHKAIGVLEQRLMALLSKAQPSPVAALTRQSPPEADPDAKK